MLIVPSSIQYDVSGDTLVYSCLTWYYSLVIFTYSLFDKSEHLHLSYNTKDMSIRCIPLNDVLYLHCLPWVRYISLFFIAVVSRFLISDYLSPTGLILVLYGERMIRHLLVLLVYILLNLFCKV